MSLQFEKKKNNMYYLNRKEPIGVRIKGQTQVGRRT